MAFEHALPPQREHELLRVASLGFEPAGSSVVRCLEHGVPWPLDRWHYHDEYELQLITQTHGHAFVGDNIGHYAPGYLALIGPRLPHNWIATDLPAGGVAMHKLVLQFLDEPLRKGMEAFPEMAELQPLLERAKHGIEFFGMTEQVKTRFYSLKKHQGLARLTEFVDLLLALSRCDDYRILSTVQMQYSETNSSMTRINRVLDYLNENYAEDISMLQVCSLVGMTEPSFSRYFSKTMGNTFTDFLNGLRIAKACQLLLRTDAYVSQVCFEVGFRNLANFNRRFLDAKGVTPTEYRKQALLKFRQQALGPSY
jgi:AraC-like DNA-binding protein